VEDLDFEGLVIYGETQLMVGKIQRAEVESVKAPVPMHPLLAGFLLAWRGERSMPKEKKSDYVFRA